MAAGPPSLTLIPPLPTESLFILSKEVALKALLIVILLYLILEMAGCWDMKRATAPQRLPAKSGGNP